MPSIEAEMAVDNNQQSKPMSGPIIGIIYPPPEVRNIVDKTASFVARNGPEFEARIRQNELGNPKFNFLSSGDPYHAYYRHKVNEFREGKDASAPSVLTGIKQLSVTSAAQQKQQELLKQVAEQQFVPKDPPAEFEFIADPPSISALDLDIVKLTAQFVARNGRQFLTNLMNREQRNFQFDFLRPQHSLFQYFTKLLEQYTKILIPPKDLLGKLRAESGNQRVSMNIVLEQVKYRANWQRHQEAQKRREEEKVEKERVAYAQIDWHDFVVVETVDYQPFETGNFPPPTTPEEVGARVLMEERLQEEEGDIEMQIESDEEDSDEEPTGPSAVKLSQMENRTGIHMKEATYHSQASKKDNTQVQDMDEASSDEDSPSTAKMQPPVAPLMPPTHDKVVVKKYDPKASQVKPVKPTATDEFLISPITGEKIPASKVAEHMRIGLLDPRWVEQRDKHTVEKINQENVYAAGTAIEASLKQLAERRTDIFGVGDEETVIGKKLGEEETKKDDRVTWDGHTSSVEAATRAARANITLEDQIHQIHKVKGLLPDEEKEKIGPKPVGNKSGGQHQNQNKSSHAPPPQQHQSHHHQQQHQGANQQSQHQQHNMPAQPPVMMMQMRGPPMMPPPFPVPGYMAPIPAAAPPITPAPAVLDQSIIPMAQSIAVDDEPPNKKLRSEDNLVPEAEFIAMHKSPITIQVQIPNVIDKSEWKLNGQTIAVSLALTDAVTLLKSKIQEETGMPPAKQKISYEGMFFKDNNTMAFYNLLSGATVHLQIKERGGRKK
ncbi:splicing factor 3A subunit 1 [Musca domestica]|uniref:Splicing factor 3A subunit 1 n=1 Tax=Musca domestica TaxID=7370 RepID=A0A1I8MY99_MUSDO|nr:splicing factor 3A subunit 1 [Musca domestica]